MSLALVVLNIATTAPEYMKRLAITADAKERGPLEYYVHSTFLPEPARNGVTPFSLTECT